MLLEMHAHTSYHSGCSAVNPATLARLIVKKGLQGLVITEHHYLWSDEELRKLREEAGLGQHFVLLSGQEVETDHGHVLVFGADKSIKKPIDLKQLRINYPDVALVWAHPFRNGKKPDKNEILNPAFDALEVFSLNQTIEENYTGLVNWHNYKFTALSGSDTHQEEKAGLFPTQFDHPVSSINGLVSELKNGRCRPFYKEIPKAGSGIVVTEITIGTKGEDEIRNRLIIKSISDESKWEAYKFSTALNDTIYKKGLSESTFRVPKIINVNDAGRIIIEEGQRGKDLFELLTTVSPESGIEYLTLAARWLARLHALKLRVSTPENTIKRERKRFASYLNAFRQTNSPYLKEAEELINFVNTREEELFKDTSGFAQLHGDYHPKNIILGKDRMHDSSTQYVSVIDFNSSMFFDPLFDAGYFLSQFASQFARRPEIIKQYPENIFLEAYSKEAGVNGNGIEAKTTLFKIRANLNIASFYIHLGMGISEEIKTLIRNSLMMTEEYHKHV